MTQVVMRGTMDRNLNSDFLVCRTSRHMRSSNIELLRIIAMLAIVAHHYVVNSTVTSLFDPMHPTANSIFLQLWGMWGAINVFVLITGYFMCESRLTAKRYLKLLFEIVFYSWVMWLVLALFGYETITLKGMFNRLVCRYLMTEQDGGFVPAFMWMYLFIPAMNVYLHATSRRGIYTLVGVLLVMFTACGTFLNANVYHHVFWYVTLYFVGATIRMCPFGWMYRNKTCVPLLCVSICLAMSSVLVFDFLGMYLGKEIWMYRWDYLVADSHKLLAFAVGFFTFVTFKNWKLPQSIFINTVASTTFGVLLIHAASNGMRKWLWQDFINVPAAYNMSLLGLIGYSVLVMFGVFAGCSALDYLRMRYIEKPLFKLFN